MPHAWTPRDLGFSLTGNWCVVRDPPLDAQLCCSSHRCPMSHLPHYVAKDTSSYPGDRCLTTLQHLGSRALRDTGPHRSWDPAYVAPSLLAVNNARGLVGTQAPSIELLPLPNTQEFVHEEGVTKAEFIKKLHERVKNQIQK